MGFSAHLLSPSRLPVLGGGKEGGSRGAGQRTSVAAVGSGRGRQRPESQAEPAGAEVAVAAAAPGAGTGLELEREGGSGQGRVWVRVGAEEPEGPCRGPASIAWRGAVDTSRRAGGGGFPAPLLPPQLKDAKQGWGRGGARRFVLRLARGATWAAEVELSRVEVEGEQAGQWEVMRGRCGCLDLFLLFKGCEECCLFSPSSPPRLSFRGTKEKPCCGYSPSPIVRHGDWGLASGPAGGAPLRTVLREVALCFGILGRAGWEEGSRWGEGGEEAGEGGGGTRASLEERGGAFHPQA